MNSFLFHRNFQTNLRKDSHNFIFSFTKLFNLSSKCSQLSFSVKTCKLLLFVLRSRGAQSLYTEVPSEERRNSMRNSSLDSQDFNRQVFLRTMETSDLFLRTAVLDSSNPRRFTNEVGIKKSDVTTLVCLAICSWEMEPEVGVLLRLAIEEKIRNKLDMFWIKAMLESKAYCFLFLQQTQRWHTRDFFGNIYTKQNLQTALSCIYFRQLKINPIVKRTVRRRGYKDKGSRRQPHELHQFVEYTNEMNLLEQERDFVDDSYQFLLGFLM